MGQSNQKKWLQNGLLAKASVRWIFPDECSSIRIKQDLLLWSIHWFPTGVGYGIWRKYPKESPSNDLSDVQDLVYQPQSNRHRVFSYHPDWLHQPSHLWSRMLWSINHTLTSTRTHSVYLGIGNSLARLFRCVSFIFVRFESAPASEIDG